MRHILRVILFFSIVFIFISNALSSGQTITMTIDHPDLQIPLEPNGPWDVQYGLGAPIQLDRDTVGLFCGLRVYGSGSEVLDMVNGTDLIIVEDLNSINEENYIKLSRNFGSIDPATHEPVTMVMYPIRGGFVPRDAIGANGLPHPYAGTGFGLSEGVPLMADGTYNWDDVVLLLQQYTYDQSGFHVASTELISTSALFSGWNIMETGLCNAIPDGNDLLIGVVGGPSGGSKQNSAFSRWRYGENGWRPFQIISVCGGISGNKSYEPSIVFNTDGSLLMAARPTDTDERILVWKSVDKGLSWTSIINKDQIRSSTPVSISRTLAGHPFITANPWSTPYYDGNGDIVPSIRRRTKISIWPVLNGRNDMLLMDSERVSQNGSISFTGTWSSTISMGGYNYTDCRIDDNTGKGTKKVKYRPNIPLTNVYSVYMNWAASPNRATNVPVYIVHSAGTSTYTADQTANGGKWNFIGQYTFNQGSSGYVEIRNDGTNGFVVADAVCFVPGNAPAQFSDIFIGDSTFTFDWTAQFGTTSNGSPLWADHPTGGIIRLRNGYHSIMGLSLWVRDQYSGYAVITPQSGCWTEQIICDDDVNTVPVWQLSIPGDLTADGKVNLEDLIKICDRWCENGTNMLEDIYSDNIINFRDFAVIAEYWYP